MTKSQLDRIEDGIKFNINDAKNTIIQMKHYLYCIYEILLRILDNLTKLTIDTGEGLDNEHFYHIIVLVELLVKEINTIVNNSQYNGRQLLTDTNKSIIFRLTNNIGHCRSVNVGVNDLTIDLPKVGSVSLGINGFRGDLSHLFT